MYDHIFLEHQQHCHGGHGVFVVDNAFRRQWIVLLHVGFGDAAAGLKRYTGIIVLDRVFVQHQRYADYRRQLHVHLAVSRHVRRQRHQFFI
jgi:hypothetical protein